MVLTKSSWFIIGATAVLIVIIGYSIGTNKTPSEEFSALGEKLDETSQETANPAVPSSGSGPASQSSTPIVASPGVEGSFGLKFTSPFQGEPLVRGAKHIITWQGIFTDRVKISLRRQSSSFNLTVAENHYASTQKYEWTLPTTLALGSDYYFVIVPQIQSYTRAATSPTFEIADDQTVSQTASVVEANPASVAAEPNCFATVTVRLVNQYSLPLSGKKVSLTTERQGVNVLASNDTTNSNGVALFKVGSTTQGTAIFTATVDGMRMNDTAATSFVTPPPFCQTR